jgi:hypothetical protein
MTTPILGMPEQQQQVLNFLRSRPAEYFRPPELAEQALGLPKGQNTGAAVNPMLYSLAKAGLAHRLTGPNGSKPRWAYGPMPASGLGAAAPGPTGSEAAQPSPDGPTT